MYLIYFSHDLRVLAIVLCLPCYLLPSFYPVEEHFLLPNQYLFVFPTNHDKTIDENNSILILYFRECHLTHPK